MKLARNKIENKDFKGTKTKLAKSLGIARSSLYYKPKLTAKDKEIKKKILTVMKENPAYGHRRIALELKLNKKRINRIMNKFSLKPARRRAWKPVKPEDLNKPETKYVNLIKGLIPTAPNEIWATDFTYLPYRNSFIYLATVIDLFTREITGYHISDHHDKNLVIGAVLAALEKQDKPPRIIHSDQGSEYESLDYLNTLRQENIQISMSRKSSPWENAFQESFYSQFKLDLGRTDRFEMLPELIEAIHQTLFTYNYKRIHTSLKMAPLLFKRQYLNNKLLINVDKSV